MTNRVTISQTAISRALDFISSIGLEHRAVKSLCGTFLPNIRICEGILEYAPRATVGDLLHKAGHIAVTPDIFRSKIDGDASESVVSHFEKWFEANPNAFGYPEKPLARAIIQSGEQEAIAWSFAAARAAKINDELPFQRGFNGEGMSVWHDLTLGHHAGIKGLHHAGMTVYRSVANQGPFFPHMKKWLQNGFIEAVVAVGAP